MAVDFTLPDLGENIESGEVVNVLVKEGDVIHEGQNVLELETDKAVIEVPSPHGGKVVQIHLKVGDSVPVGGKVLSIEVRSGAKATMAAKEPEPAEKVIADSKAAPETADVGASTAGQIRRIPPQEATTSLPPAASPSSNNGGRPPAPAGPATRRLARELGVDLHEVSGSGPGGRIHSDDVKAFVKRVGVGGAAAGARSGVPAAAPPLPDFSKWGPIDRQPMTGIRRKTAENMSVAWQNVPRVTQYDLADVTELEGQRKRYVKDHPDQPGKLTMTVLIAKALVGALKAYPQVNSSVDMQGAQVIYKNYYHLGIAVDTEHGLIVPVIRDVDQKGILDLAVELEDLSVRARQRKVTLEELQGASFTISNLGGIGGTGFSPIVNYPQVAILGVARGRQEYVMHNGTPAFRLMMPLCLSYDHRIVDGADAVRFTRHLAGTLGNAFQLFLESE
jgi:pyruvate dehydrogenase E2 component (dihydrolipoamide acetyltransferase)